LSSTAVFSRLSPSWSWAVVGLACLFWSATSVLGVSVIALAALTSSATAAFSVDASFVSAGLAGS